MKFFLTMALCISTFSALAQPVPTKCDPAGYVAMFINGVNTTLEEAELNKRAFARVVGPTFQQKKITYKLIYSPSKNIIADVYEAAKLRENSVARILIRDVINLTHGSGDAAQENSDLLNTFILNTLVRARQSEDFDLPKIMNSVFSSIQNKNAILLAGHSEGTIYSNIVYTRLTTSLVPPLTGPVPPFQIGVVSVALADNFVAGANPTDNVDSYVLSSNDKIIDNVRRRYNILNATNSVISDGNDRFDSFANHGYINTYIANASDEMLEKYRKKLSTLGAGCLSGAILNVVDTDQSFLGLPAKIELTNIFSTTIPNFQVSGSNCQERGGPIYSSFVSKSATFYGVRSTSNVPTRIGGPPANRNNCSSFIAIQEIPDPSNPAITKPRVWINGTARGQQFSSTVTLDWEYQVRFDSGNPFDGQGKRCEVGVVPNSGNYQANLVSSNCDYQLKF